MSSESLWERASIHVAVALLLGILTALQLGDPEPGLLYLAPALLLLAALAFGHYPGEWLLEAVVRSRHPVLRREGRTSSQPSAPPRSSPRGGVLLALALAGRGPPA